MKLAAALPCMRLPPKLSDDCVQEPSVAGTGCRSFKDSRERPQVRVCEEEEDLLLFSYSNFYTHFYVIPRLGVQW
jgi:hypothetical protein